jgi:hypothetical protein
MASCCQGNKLEVDAWNKICAYGTQYLAATKQMLCGKDAPAQYKNILTRLETGQSGEGTLYHERESAFHKANMLFAEVMKTAASLQADLAREIGKKIANYQLNKGESPLAAWSRLEQLYERRRALDGLARPGECEQHFKEACEKDPRGWAGGIDRAPGATLNDKVIHYHHFVYVAVNNTEKNDQEKKGNRGKVNDQETKGNRGNFKGDCRNCGKTGHKAADCWLPPKEKKPKTEAAQGQGGQGGGRNTTGRDKKKPSGAQTGPECYNCQSNWWTCRGVLTSCSG